MVKKGSELKNRNWNVNYFQYRVNKLRLKGKGSNNLFKHFFKKTEHNGLISFGGILPFFAVYMYSSSDSV